MKFQTAILYSLLAFTASIFISCDDTLTQQNPSDIVFPDTGVSYGKHVEPLFYRACAFSGCHGADTFDAQGFSLDSYDHLMFGSVVQIIRKDTADSRMMWWIERTHSVLERMPPPPRDPLNANQIRGIGRWILEGAQNN